MQSVSVHLQKQAIHWPSQVKALTNFNIYTENYKTSLNSDDSSILSHSSKEREETECVISPSVGQLIYSPSTNSKSCSLFVKLGRPELEISDLKDPVTLHSYLMWASVETQSLSLPLAVSYCALACRMINLYTWCWCQREWGTDGALHSEERLRTPIGRRMQPNTITGIHSLPPAEI